MRRRSPLALVLVLAVLIGAACGGNDRKPVAVLASAQSATVDAKSSRVALTIEPTGTGVPAGTKPITAEGVFDYAGRKGTMSMDTSALGIPGVSGALEIVLLGDVFYVKVPGGLLPGKPWLKMDLKTLGETQGIDLAGLQELGSNDPTANLRFIQGAENVEEQGSATVRGVKTTKYHFIVDLEAAKAKVPADLRDDIDRVIKQLGRSTFPADAWVDDDDLVRRLRFTYSGLNTGGAQNAGAVVTQEFFDFGVPVDAAEPPADQVSDFAQLLQGAGQGG